jgi:hypothetical protein
VKNRCDCHTHNMSSGPKRSNIYFGAI